jgi:phage tail sheath protein FI
MAIQHGISVREADTAITAPVTGSNSVQVVIGTAPVNQVADPAAVVNTPVLANNAVEAMEKLGYSADFKSFTLCSVMYAMSNLYSIGPVVFINVLDPSKHSKTFSSEAVTVVDKQGTLSHDGVIPSSLSVSAGDKDLKLGTDYTVSFEDGKAVLTLVSEATSLTVSGSYLDPSMVTASDIIGGIDSSTGKETGMEVIRQVYPKLSIVPGILEAPYYSKQAEVAIALIAKCGNINGVFKAQAFVDIPSDSTGAKLYTDVKTVKEKMGIGSTFAQAYWPQAKVGSIQLPLSVVAAVRSQYLDNVNGDVPYNSPSNKDLAITGTVLEDGTEVILDQDQANTVNSFGVVTALNLNGFRLWGNYTCAFPADNDAKNIWINVRRMFNWQANNFILNYIANVDDPMNRRLIDTIIDSENIRCSSYAPEYWAGASIEYLDSDNTTSNILAGHMIFRQHIAPYTPAQFIENVVDYDVDTLTAALTGGNA